MALKFSDFDYVKGQVTISWAVIKVDGSGYQIKPLYPPAKNESCRKLYGRTFLSSENLLYIYHINKLISLCSPEPIKVAAPPSSIPSISSSCLMPIMSIDI